MFETAELGQTVSKEEFQAHVPLLRERLLEAQGLVRTATSPVIVLFAGVDGAGKGECANLLNEWMDPHWIVTRAYGRATDDERERPEFWRFWRDLPPSGRLSIFLSAWYSKPLLDRAFGRTTPAELDEQLDRIIAFERTLVDDGALIVKFWMHLGKEQQKTRLTSLEADENQRWRVTERDWKHYEMYEEFVGAAERLIMRTSTGEAPWTIVEGADSRFRSVKVATVLFDGIERWVNEQSVKDALRAANDQESTKDTKSIDAVLPKSTTVLSRLDLKQKLSKKDYSEQLEQQQARLNLLCRQARERKRSTILVFEGWDAGGKGGAIRRITTALDAREYQVILVGAPTDEERQHHYLWRFWRHLPRAGRVTIYDRSWYGRVLVERVEGFAAEDEWRRAYAEINDFEQQLSDQDTTVLKFWIHISPKEQARRFKERETTAYKRWKLTEEDWRNRDRWSEYEVAVNDMIERTSTHVAPWVLVEGNDKRYARVKVLQTICDRLESDLAQPSQGEAWAASGEDE